MLKKLMLITVLITMNNVLGMKKIPTDWHKAGETPGSWQNWSNKIKKALAKSIYENPVSSAVCSYYLIADRSAIKRNPFWSAFWSCDIAVTFIKETFSVNEPKNFVLKTFMKHPMLSILSVAFLLKHRGLLKQALQNHRFEAMFVVGTLGYSLATNYLIECKSTR